MLISNNMQGIMFMDNTKRSIVIVCIMIIIAADHIFRVGSYLQGNLYLLYYSYFSDLAIPFGGYFLLCAAESRMPIFRHWEVKLFAAFLIPSAAETFQYFEIPVFGSTFDLFDYLAYAIGTLSAAIVDRQVFSRIFNFWVIKRSLLLHNPD
jgi:hypothetical protein